MDKQAAKGKTITETLKEIGIKRSTYYSWLKPHDQKNVKSPAMTMLTPEEKKAIEDVKEENPLMRHRQIQGILQMKGLYLSFSSVYHYLKSIDKVEPYERRPSPLKEPRYGVWQKNLMWGCDWTKLLINHIRWYLIIIIDFFSRYIVSFDIYPSINASHVKHVYVIGLKGQGIYKDPSLPELRTDRGSPNTSWVTKEFFALMGAELSYARVRRPNRHLRRVIWLMATKVIINNDLFRAYFYKRRKDGLPYKKAVLATAHKLIRIIFVMLRLSFQQNLSEQNFKWQ